MPWTPLVFDDKLLKYPFMLTVVPDDYLPFIGHVTVLWGFYEDLFDEFLEIMVKQGGKEPGPGWKMRNYKARKTLFKKQAKSASRTTNPSLSISKRCFANWLFLQRERNILTHGRIAGIPQEYGDDIIQATGFIKKKPITLVVNQKTLIQLFHGLGHLANRMQYLHDPRDAEDHDDPPHAARNARATYLRDFWSRSRPTIHACRDENRDKL